MADHTKRAPLALAPRPASMAAIQPVEVRRLPFESDSHYAKRCAAIHALQDRWVRHPAYGWHALHSTNPEVWRPAHADWWARVHVGAAADRARNPAFIRAQAVRTALEGK